MAVLVLRIEVPAERVRHWDPHEVIEDILAHAEQLPTFEPGMSWFITDPNAAMEAQEGTFLSCEWEAE